jgi:GNAT superfamily N-acetyltransferase
MSKSNFERMIQLAEDVFAVKNDPEQLDVDETVLERLRQIHPSTVSEHDDGNGPVAWMLLLPTTTSLMHQFLEHQISEKDLFEKTPLNATYDALYLCSAMVLEEYRRKGIAKKLLQEAISRIREDHPLKALFVWAFTKEGDAGAELISKLTGLPLFKRIDGQN